MRLHRFYIKEELKTHAVVTIDSPELINQVRRVFRLKVGDHIILFNGTGFDYECKIDGFEDESKINHHQNIKLNIATVSRSAFSPDRNIYLCAALIKKDHFEWVVEKATELGVTNIIPVMAERSEKKSVNLERLNKIAIEASEQSGRGTIPQISEIMTLEEAVNFSEGPTFAETNIKVLAFHTVGDSLRRSDLRSGEDMTIFIGPEGGWSEGEVELFHRNNVSIVCLGPQVLRAETAAIAALSQVVFND